MTLGMCPPLTELLPRPLQEGEELLCTRILHLGPAPAAGVGSSTAIDPSDYSPPTGGSVVLQPGVNRLVFKWVPGAAACL
jgi:hypothetical protein